MAIANLNGISLDNASVSPQNASMEPTEKPITLGIRFDRPTYQFVEAAAGREGLSAASWARRLVMLELERLREAGKLPSE